jgi:tetratricopeptide (TPR) repeat protein
MRPCIAVLVAFLLTTPLFALPPRVTFERVLPASHDLGGAEELALIQAIADTDKVDLFVDNFLHMANRSGFLRVRDVTSKAVPFNLQSVRKAEPADAWIALRAFTCRSVPSGAEAGAKDPDGKRIRQKQLWIESTCTARVETLTPTGQRSSFTVNGDGASAHGAEVTDEMRDQALERAARRAATRAAEAITPRRVRESIPLEETAPAFEAGMAMIESDRLAEARTIWERALQRNPRSAPVHFNLAAVCEALGDAKAAEEHYRAAGRLAPDEKRYSLELKMFQQRKLRP